MIIVIHKGGITVYGNALNVFILFINLTLYEFNGSSFHLKNLTYVRKMLWHKRKNKRNNIKVGEKEFDVWQLSSFNKCMLLIELFAPCT